MALTRWIKVVCQVIRNRPNKPSVIPGRMYRLKPEPGNPFHRTNFKAYVKDVQEGWVQYAIIPGHGFLNEHMKASTFLRIYEPCEQQENPCNTTSTSTKPST